MAEKPKNTVALAADLHKQAMQEEDQGNYDRAQELYKQSLEINRSIGNKSGIAYTLGQLGNVYCKIGDYAQAKSSYEGCLKISKEIDDTGSVAKALHQLAILQEEQGNYAEALKLYEDSLEIEKNLGNKSGIAESLAQMGKVAERQDDLVVAAGCYAVALVIFQKLKSPYVMLVSKWLSYVQSKLQQHEFEAAVAAKMLECKSYL